jgi:hypothetical protein
MREMAPKIRWLTLKLIGCSTTVVVTGVEGVGMNSGELLRARTARFASLRASLDAWFLPKDVEDKSVFPDHAMVQGVASIDGGLGELRRGLVVN